MNGVFMRTRKRTQSKKGHSFKSKIAEMSELPKDVILGIPMLTLMGQMELSIENYGGIIEYTDFLVRIRTKTGQIRVTGERLQVDYYTSDEMKVSGRIMSIEYLS